MRNSWRCLLLTAIASTAFVVASETDGSDNTAEFHQRNGPRISPDKKEIILQKGQNFTLKCQANTAIEFKQQDVPEENIGNFSIIQRSVIDENAEYKYEIDLDMINVDRYAIGYYACKDSSVKRDVLNYLTEEPSNNAFVSYIYIYVDGTDSLFAPMREVVTGKSDYYVVECRPTTPDVDVKISVADIAENTYIRYSPKLGFVFDSDSIEVLTDSVQLTTCGFKKQNRTVDKDLFFVKRQKDQPQPIIIGGHEEFLQGEKFSLNCSVNYTHNSALTLTWQFPDDTIKDYIIEESNNDEMSGGILYRNITILNATKEHAGVYTCFSKNNCGEKKDSFTKRYLAEPYLKVKKYVDPKRIIETAQKATGFSLEIKSYPPANFTVYRKDVEITKGSKKYVISFKNFSREFAFHVFKESVEDSDNYTAVIRNAYQHENVTYDLRFRTAPEINFGITDKTCVQNVITSLQCEVTGYPLPTVKWLFSENGTETSSTRVKVLSIYKEIAILDIPCLISGNVTCKASNNMGMEMKTSRLLVYEIPNGFGIQHNQTYDKTIWFPEHHVASVKCLASKYNYTNVTWTIYDDDANLDGMVEYSENQFSLVAKLKIQRISLNHTGIYKCGGTRYNGSMTYDTININVAAVEPPAIIFTNNINGNVQEYQPIRMSCLAYGVPRPSIQWFKDLKKFEPTSKNIEISYNIVNRTTVNSTIFIRQMEEANHGSYECVAANENEEVRESATLVLKEAAIKKYLIGIGVIFFVFIILVIYLTCKIKKEKQLRKQLAAAGLLYFKEGITKSLNPDLGIDEQAELLPYDEKFEFPSEKLVLGKQLGAGAFGVVYKAEARGIINAEQTTTVAVKMVKKTADNMFIKALASELKIMVHLGKHINIVNLLGACTKNVGKRELVVIVEYCKFGNIHNYMQRHREVFIDQFSDNNKEKNFGKVNRGYDSTGSTGVQSDYGTANTQETDHTFLTNNTNRTSRKNVPSQPTEVVKASEGYVSPEWRSNYESDYSYDGRSPRPLTSRDLLAWAFQIARGMEYLARRKVLHGDLAARNILLADDNIVKICDFGLARSIYKNNEYQREKDSLLPVKWLAIECMTDRIFSTQSDVWSFGIVLWELFSLAKTPYPNLSPQQLLQFLSEGNRLDKPAYSDDRIYNLMKRCWEQKPTARPSFTQLQEILGTFLEDNVRNHYVDLNSAYMDLNSKPDGQEDYLAMVCAPDYNNLVTPSPHHYVNEVNDARSFFPPTPTKVDEEGYLQMSPIGNQEIFSPKPTGTKFDFDPRKYNSRPSEASSGGSELTPMLTLNNLPRSGSDSDHEGNASPYPKVCPRIEEETDEVFETKLYNAKNAQNSAVSNPTYITFDIDVEKKPLDTNNYVNIVPNGLVK